MRTVPMCARRAALHGAAPSPASQYCCPSGCLRWPAVCVRWPAARDVEGASEVVLPSGVRYTDLRVGGGQTPPKGYLVVVDYV